MTKEEFLDALTERVKKNIFCGSMQGLDLWQGDLDEIITENKLDINQSIVWLFESGLFIVDESQLGFFSPQLREKYMPKQQYF